jgi:hypothetical protein
MTSESTRFLGQPKEIKPTVGAVGRRFLVTVLLYRGLKNDVESRVKASKFQTRDLGCLAIRIVSAPVDLLPREIHEKEDLFK